MVVLAPCQAQKVKPALKLTAGDTYYTISDINSTVTQNLNGQQASYTIGMAAKTAFKVIDIKDTVYDMEVRYQSIGMKMQSTAGDMDFNSDRKDAQDIPSKVLAAMVDKPFLVTLSTTGRVLEVKNIEKIMASVFDGLPQMDTLQKQQLMGQFLQSFGEKSFKSNLEQSLAIYPSVKVSKGDKWIVNTLLESVMVADVQSTYELQDITDTYYLIHGDSRIATVRGRESQVNGMPVSYDLTGIIVSDIEADKTTGWVAEAKIKQDISGTFQIKDNPKLPGGMLVPMTVHTDMITTDK